MTQYKAKSIIHYARIAAALTIAAAIMITGCKPTVSQPQIIKDTTPPAEVTELKALGGNGKISVSWKNPADEDLHQVEITGVPAAGSLSTPVYLAVAKGETGSYIVEGLAADTKYTVTVKTIDKALNKSKDGRSTTATTNAAGNVMIVTLTASTAAKTNSDITVTITSSTSIKEAKWKKGVHNANEIFASGTAITGTSFTVSENGIYSVAVLDNDGRREVETIKIDNIDKTLPASIKNLTVGYSSTSNTITVRWDKPSDTDIKELHLICKKGETEINNETLSKDTTSFTITNILADETTYTITISAKDEVGNTGAPAETTVKATASAEVTGISLSRTHLDTEMTDRTITITVSGSNFDQLTSFKVQVKADGGFAELPVDVNPHTGIATVSAPIPSPATDEGTTYTVTAIVNGTPVPDKTATFKVTKPARVESISLSNAQLPANTPEPITVTVTGKNFDIRGETKIKLLDSNGDEAVGSTVTVAENVGNETEFTADITGLPAVSGVYTVAVFFKGNKQTETAQLQLYGAPEITSVSIPKAGTPYGGNKLPVTIKGKNFTAPGASFSGSGASITNFTVVNDTFATAEVTCPYSAEEHTVTVTCGTASNTGTLRVKDYTGYEVGKIVLANKALVEASNYSAIDPSNPPVGIICGDLYGVPRMIALHTSSSSLKWAKNGSTGYNTQFEGIICRSSQAGYGAAQTATFTGDTDGSDNWEYIKQQDPAGAADAATNYPAFHWVNQYNTQYAAQLGGTNFAWYMPSLAELCEVYKNRDAINASFAKIHGLDSDYANSTLGTSWYWSSSQDSYINYNAWRVDFGAGYVAIYGKVNDLRVCCLAGF